MTENDQQIITIADILAHSDSGLRTESDYVIMDLNQAALPDTGLPRSFRIDAMTIMLCTGTGGTIKLNFSDVEIHHGDILTLDPRSLIELPDCDKTAMSGYAVFLSRDFLNLMSFDSSTVDFTKVDFNATPRMHLDDKQLAIVEEYFKMLKIVADAHTESNIYTRNVERSLISALIYQLMDMRSRIKNTNPAPDDEQPSGTRRNLYARDFMKLVAKHFRTERSIAFYADQLFISAKYLSLIIKEATGHTATEWIDHFVVLEAKNQLRFSGRNIQQIAYDLNFHNQSSFGKYFKNQTGMSPSEFRRG